MNSDVAFFFEKASHWKEAYEKLRNILLSTGLNEELKWGKPCYTLGSKNIVLIHGFKKYCALLFHQGALLKDPEHILVRQTENVQSARQLRFASLQDIENMKPSIKAYVYEAIEVEKAGLDVSFKKTAAYPMPEELASKLTEDTTFKKAFEALTPGRQRGYLLHIGQPKQAKTRISRIEKSIPKILDGKGYNER